jgi:hypothetical protein
MKIETIAVFSVLLFGNTTLAGTRSERLPLGGEQAVTENATLHVNNVQVDVSLKAGTTSTPLSVGRPMPYVKETDGPIDVYLKNLIASGLEAVPREDLALEGRILNIFYRGTHLTRSGTNLLLLVDLSHYVLREEGGRIVIPSEAYAVDIPAAAKAAVYTHVPLFVPEAERVEVELPESGNLSTAQLDSRDPASAPDLRKLEKGLFLYARHLLISGRRGTVTATGRTEKVYDHATGRLIGGEGALSLSVARFSNYVFVEIRGKVGENIVFVERSTDLLKWELYPGIFASRDEGYANYFVPLPAVPAEGAEFFRAYIPDAPTIAVSQGASP